MVSYPASISGDDIGRQRTATLTH